MYDNIFTFAGVLKHTLDGRMGCCGESREESDHLLKHNTKEESSDKDTEISDTTDTTRTKRNNILCGYGLALITVALLVTGYSCAQALNESIPHSELNGFRFAFQLVITSPFLLAYKKCDARIERKLIGWLLLGAVALTSASYGQYGAVYYLPLGVSIGIQFSFALILNSMISCCVNRVVRWYEIAAATLCAFGAVMITQPAFMFRHYTEQSQPHMISNNTDNYTFHPICHGLTAANSTGWSTSQSDTSFNRQILGYIFCLCGGLAITIYIQVVNRKLGEVSILICNTWFSLFGMLSSFCIMVVTETPFFPSLPTCISFFVLHSCSAAITNIVVYKTAQLLEPFTLSLIFTLQIPFTFIIQFTIFEGFHSGRFNAVVISGACLVFFGNLLNPIYHVIQEYRSKHNMK